MKNPSESVVQHSVYLHAVGRHLLQMQLNDRKKREQLRTEMKRKSTQHAQLLRKRVNVIEMDDGGLSVAIDQEWDTTAWTPEMIIAGCEALSLIFHSCDSNVSDEKKARAVVLLEKLMYRHTVAESYIRKCMESLIGNAVNRLLRRGKSASMLDLLYILHSCRERFAEELSKYNFSGNFHEMVLMESKLAAILIQHTFRSYRKRQIEDPYNPWIEGFGTTLEKKRDRKAFVIARNFELRINWRMMHWGLEPDVRQQIGGFRGPAHIPCKYVLLGLEIILQLVVDQAGAAAARNREDVVRANGCILLACFVSAVNGPFSQIAARILANVVKAAESVNAAIHSGCVRAIVRFMEHLRVQEEYLEKCGTRFHKLDADDPLAKGKLSKLQIKMASVKSSIIDCATFIRELAVHAAGVFCARGGYEYEKVLGHDRDHANYFKLLRRFPYDLEANHIRDIFGDPRLMAEILSIIMRTKHNSEVKALLKAALALACGDCHGPILLEVVSKSGAGMRRLFQLMEETDDETACLALAVFVQLGTLASGRDGLIATDIAQIIYPQAVATSIYSRKSYEKAILVSAVLCRQSNWRACDPDEIYLRYLETGAVRKAIYLDLLITIKRPTPAVAPRLSIGELVLLQNDRQATIDMSRAAETIGVLALSDYFSHPGEESYFSSLSWTDSVACCEILAGLSMHHGAAENMCAHILGPINFIGKVFFFAKHTFLASAVAIDLVELILNGVSAAGLVLKNLSLGCIGHDIFGLSLKAGVRQADIIESVVHFVKTLAMSQDEIPEKIRQLQLQVGINVLEGFDGYASFLHSRIPSEGVGALLELAPGGMALCDLLRVIRGVHGISKEMVTIFHCISRILSKLTLPTTVATTAVNEWHIVEAMREHLPLPLSAIYGVLDAAYVTGLGLLPSQFFDLCRNLCQSDRGCSLMLADGFLRRTIEKLMLLFPLLESRESLVRWNKDIAFGKPFPEVSKERRECVSCLQFIKSAANNHNAMYGNANDVILHENFSVVEICMGILTTAEMPLGDGLLHAAIEALCAICHDTARLADKITTLDILGVMRNRMANFESFPESTVMSMIDAVRFVAGVRTTYLTENIASLRNPLTKIARLRPSCADAVRDAQWAMTRAGFSTKRQEDTDAAAFVDSQGDMMSPVRKGRRSQRDPPPQTFATPTKGDAEDFAYFNTKSPSYATWKAAYESSPKMNNFASFDDKCEEEVVSTQAKRTIRNRPDQFVATHEVHDHQLPQEGLHAEPGSVRVCGPTQCGSLRYTESPSKHGNYSHISTKEMDVAVKMLPTVHEGKLAASKEFVPVGSPVAERISRTRQKMVQTELTASKLLSSLKSITKELSLPQLEKRSVSAGSGSIPRETAGLRKQASLNLKELAPPKILTVSVEDIPELLKTKPRKPK